MRAFRTLGDGDNPPGLPAEYQLAPGGWVRSITVGGPVVSVGGDDTLTAGAGNDSVFGGGGNDLINGGDGNDWMERRRPYRDQATREWFKAVDLIITKWDRNTL